MTTKQEFNCIFCKDVFKNKEDLQEHFRKHGDPKYKNRFEIDTQATDEKSKEKDEMVGCDVCSQVFPTISKAITHKHKVHPDHDAKYFCPWCGKLFTMKHLYNVHVQSSHANQKKADDKSFRCDTCSVDFFIPSAMIYHNKFFHRQDTDLPDLGQSKKVKLYSQEIIQIYYCAFCGEEYENKVNLIKHISDDHEDENQSPDEVLKCPLCEAVFYHLDAYEIHLTFHSSEDTYSVRNPEYSDLLDYSLETVPPIIEKVESFEQDDQNPDTITESTMNAVGIEKFLELAMDQSDDSNPVKVKKHKKHKKSKKSAITLDEFLNMNQDVFGEGLDFQGIEEVPTRVVKKHLKNNKKTTGAATASAELEKLKKAGIVIKRKVGKNPVKNLKGAPRPTKDALNKSFNKINPETREIKTSSEVLTKLINQSNNQIKIVKKSNPNNGTTKNDPNVAKDVPVKQCETTHENSSANLIESNNKVNETKFILIPKSDDSQNITKDSSPKPEESSVTATSGNAIIKKLSESATNSDDFKQITKRTSNVDENTQKVSEELEFDQSPKAGVNKTLGLISNVNNEEKDKNKFQMYSDQEFEEREYESDTDNFEKNDNRMDEINDNSPAVSSLSTLKHLSHFITVKPVSQIKNTSVEPTNYKITETKDNQSPQSANKKDSSNFVSATETSKQAVSASKPKVMVDKDPTMDALKTLSKNITIKSLSTKRNSYESVPEDDVENIETEKTSNLKLQDVCANKNITIKKMKVEMSESNLDDNYLNSQQKEGQPGKSLNKKAAIGKRQNRIVVENADKSPPTSNTNILKRLTSITTKPIFNKTNYGPSTVQQANTAKKIVQTSEKKEEIIEIFDVDDSEDEIDNNSNKPEPTQTSEHNNKQSEPTQKSMDALKYLSKNITIKSLNQQMVQKSIKIENNIKIEKDDDTQGKDDSNVDALMNMQNKDMSFQNILQGLSKNITIKSRNSSPSQFLKSQEHSQDSKAVEDNEASDSDSCSGNVKITELDDDVSNNEDNSERTEINNRNRNNPIIDSPNESCSDNEEMDENLHDFEAELQFSTVQKSTQNINSSVNSVCLNNLKNTNKNITIKSLSKSSTDKDDTTKQAQKHGNLEIPHIQNKHLTIKSSKQVVTEPHNDNLSNKVSKNIGQIVDHTSTLNQKMCAMNQVNTINKEVTVKTFQTKTVIQEITTTVTKTIKTVNQTVKQEMRNTCQTNAPMLTQRVQGMRPKNLQGVVIRHSSPMLGARPSNILSQIRPASTVVRPSKQIVPISAGMNVMRPNNPRMAVGRKVIPSPSPNKPVTGKPLKISPSAMAAASSKRPNTEDMSGPFSCFKKPKESLIPVSDIPIFTNSGDEANAQFTAASHTSTSNFTCSTKTIKGNSVVTAKQMKSEVSSQQVSRLSNTTGVKIMTSQAKQTQVQEKSEASAMKRTTLEAIQRLQKQGLLVKKPRVDVNEGDGESDHDGDNNVGNSSVDEYDE